MEKYFEVAEIENLEHSSEAEKVEKLLEKYRGKLESLDEGGNAIVFIINDPRYENICFKKCKDKPQIKYNNIHEEHDYQLKAKNLGVRTPSTLLSVKTESGEEFLVMERVKGYSVEQIVNNPKLLPSNFDYWIFCNDLEDQISKLHQSKSLAGTGIYHRDLHNRNVMINDMGQAVIIDFGTSTEGTGGEFTYEESVAMFNPNSNRYEFVTGYFKNDDTMVKNIKSSLKQFMK